MSGSWPPLGAGAGAGVRVSGTGLPLTAPIVVNRLTGILDFSSEQDVETSIAAAKRIMYFPDMFSYVF